MDPLSRFRDRLDIILSIESKNGLRQCTKETLTEGDLVHIGNLLRYGANKLEWAKRPRLFAILYIIGCMEDESTMDEFVRLGYKDTALPFGDPLPPLLKSHKARFKENQKRIFTGVSDLENGRGHQYFEDGDKYYSEGRQLGIGSYAYVYEVFSKQSFENFARKMFNKPRRHDEALRISKAVADEVEHLKGLSHRHLIKFIGSYTDMKYIAILTQPVARCNLMEFLNQSPLPPADKSRLPCYFGCLANALQYLHAPPRRIKHKDLKPGNILVSSEGRVLITDFGSATSFWETGQSTTMGSEFTLTVDYAPREVVELKPRNTKVDVYSLGAVFFEMWTVLKGESIMNMKSYFSRNGSHGGNIRTNPIAVAEWSEHLTALPGHLSMNKPIGYIRRMIQDNPNDRPDMDEIVLETVGSGQTSRFCCPECMSEYTDEGIFRRFHAEHLNPTILRSNSAVPEKTSQSKAADSTSVVARPKSEMGNSAGTAQPSAAVAISHPQPSGNQLMPTRLETLPAISIEGAPLAMTESSTAASQSKTTTPGETPPVEPSDTPEPLTQKSITESETKVDEEAKTAADAKTNADISTRDQLGETEIAQEKPRVERDVARAFRNFTLQQRKNIEIIRSQKKHNDQQIKLDELKKFAKSFKLQTPVPSDLVSIIGKDPLKQKEIQERAKRNVEATRANNVYRNAAPKSNPQSKTTPHSKDHKISPLDAQAEAFISQESLPSITEVPNRVWVMPEKFDWTYMEMNNLIRLKMRLSPKDFRKVIVTEFPERSGSNVKKFWTAFCQTNNVRTAV